MALQRCVSLEPNRTGQKAKRPAAWMSHRCQAFHHRPVSADPRPRAHHPHRRGSLSLPRPLRKRPGGEAAHMARTGHRPRPGCPEAAQGRGHRGCDTLHLQPSWAFKGKKFEAWLCKLFKDSASPGLFSHFGGLHEGPSLETLPTLPSSPNLLLCMPVPNLLPACQSPRKLEVAAAPGSNHPQLLRCSR